MAVEFFQPVSTYFPVDTSIWEVQSSSKETQTQLAADTKSNGDVAASKTLGVKDTVTCTYVCKAESGNLVIPSLGATGGSNRICHIDQISVTYSQRGAARMTITGHYHDGVTHEWTRQQSPTITLPARVIGIPADIVGLAASGVGIRSLTYTISIKHFDEYGESGELIGSGSCDATETLTGELTSETSVSVTGFTATVASRDKVNTGVATNKFALVKHIVTNNINDFGSYGD